MSEGLTPEEEAWVRQVALAYADAFTMDTIVGDLENVNFTGLLAHVRDLEGDLPTPVLAAPPKTVWEILQDAANAIPAADPKTTAARIELGSISLAAIPAAVPSFAGWSSPLATLWGVPMVENLSLPPYGWRMASLDGTVMGEGEISP